MHPDAMRALYDDDRRMMEEPGFRREVDGPVVRYVNDQHAQIIVLVADLHADIADEHIRRQITYARGLGYRLEWKLLSYDFPTDMRERLVEYGFVPAEPETVMMLAMDELPATLQQPPMHAIRRVTTDAGLADVIALHERIWGEPASWLDGSLLPYLGEGGHIAMYTAIVDGQTVASARLVHLPGRAVGGLWGGATLPEYRNQGIYTDLLRARVQEAIRRGAQLLMVDAGPMSRPILEKLGFQPIATVLELALDA